MTAHDIPKTFLSRVEFHRNAFALYPDESDKRPGVAYFIKGKSGFRHRFCSCVSSQKGTCVHIMEFSETYKKYSKKINKRFSYDNFRASVWHRIAEILTNDSAGKKQDITVKAINSGSCDTQEGSVPRERYPRVFSNNGEPVLYLYSNGQECMRLMERCDMTPREDNVPNRGAVLQKLSRLTLTENEIAMSGMGFKTRRQVFEESFWYRFAYHGYIEYGIDACTFLPSINNATGEFSITFSHVEDKPENNPVFRIVIPRGKVQRLLNVFRELLPNQHEMAIHPVPLKSIFNITMNTKLDLEIRPQIELIQETGESKFFDRQDLEKFRYGDLVFVPELGILAELEKEGGVLRKFKAPVNMVLKKSQVPTFMEEFGEEILSGENLVDEKVRQLQIFRECNRMEIQPEVISRDWCWLSMEYGFGNIKVSLADILTAKKDGSRYISTDQGWIDCDSYGLKQLDVILSRYTGKGESERPGQIKISRMDLFRLNSMSGIPVNIKKNGEQSVLLENMFQLKPARPYVELKGMTSTLRPYQKNGVEWLRFLYENGFGGILCDDMGLGKTHQVMSLMVSLRELDKEKGHFIVVCPTTVLSHWENKILGHAPALKPSIYHGGRRDLACVLENSDTILTSYGILRQDIELLKDVSFTLAVFDEIQNIKNPVTLSYESASAINATMKLGLTGTPVENNLYELKAHMDLTLPGYLGTDKEFNERYGEAMVQEDHPAGDELRKLLRPFTLRRLKQTVLSDLPEKIEDIRTCALSDDQVKLYRDAIESRGKKLLETLNEETEPIPYIHIFALLNLLKQICNHPAMVSKDADNFHLYDSGKWDLFKELIEESLYNGQKVVVYSQYLDMIKIINNYFVQQGVDFVSLTGQSRNRADIISRFNDDPECRIFVGSLKAGGVGIDLTSASVVIHYDRWWNAAKEDQATDRVHRIGQKRGVQVFKLVTRGTLEEKIAALIDRKRNIMENVIKENDPGMLHIFSKEDLIDLLSVSA